MTDSTFSEMLTRIYAAFGKSAPSETSPVYTFLFKRVAFIDDRYCDGIAAAIECYDKAPTNVGVAILNEYYKLKPESAAKEHQCPHCYKNTGFIFFVHPTYASPHGYVAKCPSCNGGSNAEIAYQIAQGSKTVPDNKSPRLYWEECFGEWIPPTERATGKDHANTDKDTGTDGNGKVAGHFKPIAQAVDNLNDALDDFWNEA